MTTQDELVTAEQAAAVLADWVDFTFAPREHRKVTTLGLAHTVITLHEQLAAANVRADAGVALGVGAAARVLDDPGDSAATKALGQQICCSGHDCGCQGADVGAYLQHIIRALAPMTALEAAMLLPEVAAMRKAIEEARVIVPEAMKALMFSGREALLVADKLHKADDKVRDALAALPDK